MQRALKNKEYNAWQNNMFTPIPDSIAQQINCTPYLEEMPIFVDLEERVDDIESEFEKKIDDFFDELLNKNKRTSTQKRGNTRTKRTERSTTRSDEVRKHNERVKKQKERQKKRKNFFRKIFGDG